MIPEIVNLRIDERLIHGQVAAAWVKDLAATRIMVIDAAAAKTEIQKIALKMACPMGLKLSILSPETAVTNLQSGKYTGERIMVVLKGTETLQKVSELGLEIASVNVGNMSGKDDTRFVKKAVNITPADESIFRQLASKMRFTAQLVPTDPATDFIPMLG